MSFCRRFCNTSQCLSKRYFSKSDAKNPLTRSVGTILWWKWTEKWKIYFSLISYDRKSKSYTMMYLMSDLWNGLSEYFSCFPNFKSDQSWLQWKRVRNPPSWTHVSSKCHKSREKMMIHSLVSSRRTPRKKISHTWYFRASFFCRTLSLSTMTIYLSSDERQMGKVFEVLLDSWVYSS